MKPTAHRIQLRLALALGVLGVALLLFVITVEDEPGAVPLLMIVASALWAMVLRVRARKA